MRSGVCRCQCDAPAREYQPPVLRCKRVRSAAESDRLAVQPTYIAFNAVNVHTTSPVLSFHVRASPTSQTDDKHEPIVSARCRNINPSFDSNLSPFMLGLDTTACGADGVAFPLVLPLPGDLPVSFRPEAKGVYTAHIELLAEDESVLATVTVVGIGGEAFVGEHFSHPVMEADPVYIALPGEATAQVPTLSQCSISLNLLSSLTVLSSLTFLSLSSVVLSLSPSCISYSVCLLRVFVTAGYV